MNFTKPFTASKFWIESLLGIGRNIWFLKGSIHRQKNYFVKTHFLGPKNFFQEVFFLSVNRSFKVRLFMPFSRFFTNFLPANQAGEKVKKLGKKLERALLAGKKTVKNFFNMVWRDAPSRPALRICPLWASKLPGSADCQNKTETLFFVFKHEKILFY